MNQALAFGLLLGGGILLEAGLTGKGPAAVLTGTAGPVPNQGTTLSNGVAGIGGAASNAFNSVLNGVKGVTGGVNPFPGGWQPSRLDQGYDGTFKGQINSPISGKVVYSSASDPGWQGGGYVAVQSPNPIPGLASRTFYFAEGIAPTVHVGQVVSAGQPIATPIPNPYNGITGNIEWGLASDQAPGSPLAQHVGDPRQMVLNFSQWAQKVLGVAPPASTGNAGSP